MRHVEMILTLVVAGSLTVGGCAVDDSMPTRPRTASPFTPNPKAQDNAERRVLEAPSRNVPTGSGREFPGQSKATTSDADPQVVTLEADSASGSAAPSTSTSAKSDWKNWGGWPTKGWDQAGHYHGPTTEYNRDIYNDGPLPHLPPAPGSVPMVGAAPVPGTDLFIDYSWGQVLQLQSAAHRDWPETQGHYEVADVKHNPVYYFNAQDFLPVEQTTGTSDGDIQSTLLETPWFFLNTLLLPKLMILEPPLAQRATHRQSSDPNYLGYLPTAGPIIPVPTPGVMRWEYPFLNSDGSVKEKYESQLPANNPPATAP